MTQCGSVFKSRRFKKITSQTLRLWAFRQTVSIMEATSINTTSGTLHVTVTATVTNMCQWTTQSTLCGLTWNATLLQQPCVSGIQVRFFFELFDAIMRAGKLESWKFEWIFYAWHVFRLIGKITDFTLFFLLGPFSKYIALNFCSSLTYRFRVLSRELTTSKSTEK